MWIVIFHCENENYLYIYMECFQISHLKKKKLPFSFLSEVAISL